MFPDRDFNRTENNEIYWVDIDNISLKLAGIRNVADHVAGKTKLETNVEEYAVEEGTGWRQTQQVGLRRKNPRKLRM